MESHDYKQLALFEPKQFGTKYKQDRLANARAVASSKGGHCLSDIYINIQLPLLWRCSRGHEWKANYYSVVTKGSWCRSCSDGLSERLARQTFEKLFNSNFPKCRPEWLRNPETGRKLELDGYNEELQLAFEYQGGQHYRPVSKYSMDQKKLENIQKRDATKRSLCISKGILLIEIPDSVIPSEFPKWVHDEILKTSSKLEVVGMLRDWKKIKLDDWIDTDSYSIKDLQKYAHSKGGKCLSSAYFGANVNHDWECNKGHRWSSKWSHMTNLGTWCPRCSGRTPCPHEQISKAKLKAQAMGGKLLSIQYENSHQKMEWMCSRGHRWKAKYTHIIGGASWCPYCAGVKVDHFERQNEVSELVAKKGGAYISGDPKNNKSKLRLKCSKDHEWETEYRFLKGGSWCPWCTGRRVDKESKLKIALAKAVENGGSCLSSEYINSKAKMVWQCKNGHQWEASYGRVVREGTWCRKCPRQKTNIGQTYDN